MNFYITQTIHINYIKIGGINNSSVFQIGSAGYIRPLSNLYNTGGFFEPAPPARRRSMSQPAVPLAAFGR
ncbi:spore germination protein GerPB [Metabacillus sp. GX 13764]|uniref:spore germination protein GerPB n=1 Tax=Metabacillus kandeliae TaxID=2900151 RepID=UPI001E42BAB2|nr:spore germination protein GerPB [Metabacillus kandeliae]MCD7034900.1 spore germination protein GerPB [Metabacillus kandeliae]